MLNTKLPRLLTGYRKKGESVTSEWQLIKAIPVLGLPRLQSIMINNNNKKEGIYILIEN